MDLTINIEQVTINVVEPDSAILSAISSLANQATRIEGKIGTVMGTTAEALVVIGQIRTDTDRVADKLDELADRPDVNEEVTAALRDAGAHLRGVASAFDPVEPEPDVIPGSDPLPEDEPVPTDGGDSGSGDGGAPA